MHITLVSANTPSVSQKLCYIILCFYKIEFWQWTVFDIQNKRVVLRSLSSRKKLTQKQYIQAVCCTVLTRLMPSLKRSTFSWYFQLVRNFIPPLWADRERGTNYTNCLQKPALIGSATTWFILHHRLHLSLVLTLVIVNELQNYLKEKRLVKTCMCSCQNKGRNASIKVNLNWYLN